jgi:hypothetical protein
VIRDSSTFPDREEEVNQMPLRTKEIPDAIVCTAFLHLPLFWGHLLTKCVIGMCIKPPVFSTQNNPDVTVHGGLA